MSNISSPNSYISSSDYHLVQSSLNESAQVYEAGSVLGHTHSRYTPGQYAGQYITSGHWDASGQHFTIDFPPSTSPNHSHSIRIEPASPTPLHYVAFNPVPSIDSDPAPFKGKSVVPWLQNIVMPILYKDEIKSKPKQTSYIINSNGFLTRLFKQYEYVCSHFAKLPKKLLIGLQEYNTLMNYPMEAHKGVISFDAMYSVTTAGSTAGSTATNTTIYGLRVHVIPWMNGILVLPDDI